MFSPKKILVPTDFSLFADNALKQAIDIAKQNKARIFLFHVIDDGFQQCTIDYCINEGDVRKILKDSMKNAKDKLEQEAKKINNKHSDIEIVYDVKRGVPYKEILNEQEKRKIDLIVIASHGKTGILKNLMGGVADKVVKAAKCQVLLVKS
jgi:universal stress protein A